MQNENVLEKLAVATAEILKQCAMFHTGALVVTSVLLWRLNAPHPVLLGLLIYGVYVILETVGMMLYMDAHREESI